MKKIILALGYLLVLFGSPCVFAQINDEQSAKDKIIYCPSQITCENKICSFDSENSKYFGQLSIIGNNGNPLLSYYKLQSTTATFHSNNTKAICHYGKLDLEIKPESNLEAYHIEGASWPGKSSLETCTGKCPLHESMGFVIANFLPESLGGVYASIGQKEISNLIKDTSHIIFDDALVGCSGTNECIINLLSEQHKVYGYAIVDMVTMKVLETQSFNSEISIKKINTLNAISIGNINTPKETKAIYCPPVIKCNNTNCTFASLDAEYFGEIIFSRSPQGEQLFLFKRATYYGSSFIVDCSYSNQQNDTVSLESTRDHRMEIHVDKSGSQWSPADSSLINTCANSSTEQCPLKKRFDIEIHNNNVHNGLYASIGNTYISRVLFSNDTVDIAYHEALPGCENQKECTIDVLSGKQARYGAATIDTNTMRILRVNSLYPQYIGIKKVSKPLFDIVEISYLVNLKLIPPDLR